MEENDAELCELIGIYIQFLQENPLEKDQMSLYQDNGLVMLSNINNQQTSKIRKMIISVFKSINFKIETTTNLTELIVWM